MFGKFTYLYYTLIFTIPLILFLWFYFLTILKKNLLSIAITTALLTLYGFFLWPTGLAWKTWVYNGEKILGVSIFGTVLEDIVWWLFISLLLASFAIVMIKKEQQKERLMRRS